MCCSGDKTDKSSEQASAALQNAQAAFSKTLQSSFQQAFSSNQSILASLTSILQQAINNPQGFSPETLAALKAGATDTVAKQTQNALTQVGAYNASHGGAELGSGVAEQLNEQAAVAGAEEQAGQQQQIAIQNGQLQNENYWRGIQGLTNVAQAYDPQGYANSEANIANSSTNAANSVANLSNAELASQQAGWQNTFGLISGIAGLGLAGVGAANTAGVFGGATPGSKG